MSLASLPHPYSQPVVGHVANENPQAGDGQQGIEAYFRQEVGRQQRYCPGEQPVSQPVNFVLAQLYYVVMSVSLMRNHDGNSSFPLWPGTVASSRLLPSRPFGTPNP